jgi:N-acetylglucosaminyldiphosphoundecaprenol N-acetyl-beta-D-mannosaminyltransferase
MRDRVNILGIGVSALNLPSTVTAIRTAIETRAKGYICVTGVHGVSEAQTNPELRAILNGAFLNTPDGMPMVWVGRWNGHRAMDRVYGPDLLLEICRVSEQTKWKHFFYGSAPGVADQLAATLQARYPQLLVVGTYCPPYRPLNAEEKKDLCARVAKAKPDIIWVGLSTPKQEVFMSKALPWLDTTLMIGVGAAFDLLSGRVQQAPRWIQRSGFEWLYRTFQEPRRLSKRYLKNNPLFIGRLFLQITRFRGYPLDDHN